MRARFALAGAVLGVFLLLIPAAALGQTWRGSELERRMEEAPWHFGPLLIQPSLVISNAGVDSNVFYTPSNPVRDFTLTAGPAATFYLPVRRKLVLSVYGSPQYVWYSKSERERTWNYFLNGAAQLNLKNVFLSLEGVYSDARQRWSTEIDIRPRRKETGYGGSILVNLAHRTSFGLGLRTVKYDYESIDYEGSFNIRERLNHQATYATTSMYYRIDEGRRFFLDLEYGRFDYEFATQATLRDAESYSVFGGLEFSELGRRIRGLIRLGYKQYDVRDADSTDFKGLVGDTRLSLRVSTLLTVRGSYLRDVNYSLWFGDSYFILTRPGAGLSLYVLPFLRLDYDYSKGKNKYPVAGGEDEDQARLDIYDTHSGGLYFRIMENTGLGFVVSWWKRDSNIDGQDDERMFYGLNLTYDF
jgi:hypothetical protein